MSEVAKLKFLAVPVSVSVDSVNKPWKGRWNNIIKLVVFNLFNTIVSSEAEMLNVHTDKEIEMRMTNCSPLV